MGAFVSLHLKELRGSVGRLEGEGPSTRPSRRWLSPRPPTTPASSPSRRRTSATPRSRSASASAPIRAEDIELGTHGLYVVQGQTEASSPRRPVRLDQRGLAQGCRKAGSQMMQRQGDDAPRSPRRCLATQTTPSPEAQSHSSAEATAVVGIPGGKSS